MEALSESINGVHRAGLSGIDAIRSLIMVIVGKENSEDCAAGIADAIVPTGVTFGMARFPCPTRRWIIHKARSAAITAWRFDCRLVEISKYGLRQYTDHAYVTCR